MKKQAHFLRNVSAKDPNYAYALHKFGNALSNRGDYEEAFEAYDNATKVKPSYYNSWYNKGNMLSELGYLEENQSRYEEAIKMYNETVRISPDYYPHGITWATSWQNSQIYAKTLL